MEGMPFVPGFRSATPGPLARFLPPLEQGTVAAWLQRHVAPSSWVLDPFGFSPQLVVEAARAGYRVLVTVNNPITHFLLEMAASPPSSADFKAALADLAASKRGDERLETHLRALYATRCETCGQEIEARTFLWRRGEDVPYARNYECPNCGDKGEHTTTLEDIERVRKLAGPDALHRSRALERVAPLEDEDRSHVQEALEHYLARPIYVLTTLVSRRDALHLPPERDRALAALILMACDAGNTLWDYPAERPRPKALITHNEFREHNLWAVLEEGVRQWDETAAPVTCVSWPKKIPGDAGICIYEGRLRGLAHEVRQEIPIAAIVGSIPRPNQAFWTLSALWAGWLWGRLAAEPFKVALRRRRYDWAWNATALHSAFQHLFDLVALGTPFFGLMPEAEPPFLTSALTATSAAGWDLKGLALRTEDDPVQFLWERGEHLKRQVATDNEIGVGGIIQDYLRQRGEPTNYLHVHAAAVQALADAHYLNPSDHEFDAVLRESTALIEQALKADQRFVHYSSGEGVDTGMWGLSDPQPGGALADRVEQAIVNALQKNPESIYLEVEEAVYVLFPGLLTPSKALLYAILDSYASRKDGLWKLREEDLAGSRRADIPSLEAIVAATGTRLGYEVERQGKWIVWQEGGRLGLALTVLASAIVSRAIAENPFPPEQSILVVPGGRAGLIAYKQQRDPALAAKMQPYRLAKFRLWRALSAVPILTRESFLEQLAADPIERATGQMMMF